MIGHLYRYPHPSKDGVWIYVGQGPKRDAEHRRGASSFGRRFRKLFPGISLPQPIREQITITNQYELNEEEIIRMFQYRTWCGYSDGMNRSLRYAQDFAVIGEIHREAVRAAMNAMGFEARSLAAKRGSQTKGPAVRSLAMKKAHKTMGPEGQSLASKKGRRTIGPERLSAIAKKIAAAIGPERRSEIAKKRQMTKSPEIRRAWARAGARMANHLRHHIKRGVVSPGCDLCAGDSK